MTRAKIQPAQAKPQRVQISGYPAEFFSELQQLVKAGYCVVLEGAEFPHCLMNQWHIATLVLEA